jgi:E3 ubiquitin-protein ligase RNF1/2
MNIETNVSSITNTDILNKDDNDANNNHLTSVKDDTSSTTPAPIIEALLSISPLTQDRDPHTQLAELPNDQVIISADSIPPLSTDSNSRPSITAIELNALVEEQRPVREVLTDDTPNISVTVRDLNTYITCVVCLGIIRQCTIVLNCLHRFCSKCINDSLRFGNKECPQCRAHCPSKRNLRPDPVFDSIISLIYPDLDETEAERENETERIIRASNVVQFAQSALQGQMRQKKRAKHS